MATYTCVHTSLATPFITPPSTSNCLQNMTDSDCGSSSGLGGMKTHEPSDEGASSTSSQLNSVCNSPSDNRQPSISGSSSPIPPPPSTIPPIIHQPLPPPTPPQSQSMVHPVMSSPPPPTPPSQPSQPIGVGPVVYSNQPTPQQLLPAPAAALPALPPPPPQQQMMVPMGPAPMTSGMMPMPWMGQQQQQQPGPNNCLFVHIQAGETLQLLNNGETQTVIGPATLNMMGDVGQAHIPLPIAVPPGHQCHQFVDELGILRHIVLSLEPPNSRTQYPREMNVPQIVGAQIVSNGITTYHQPPMMPSPLVGPSIQSPGPMMNQQLVLPAPQPLGVQPYQNPNNNNNNPNRKWTPRAPNPTNDQYYQEVEQDVEENDRIREMLSRLTMPQVARVLTTEVDIVWQPIDTSEASAPGGPFPQIDASEFTYHATIYENTGRFVASYILDQTFTENNPYGTFSVDPNVCNKVRVGNLRPNTDYSVQIKSALEERGLSGEPSPHLFFRTAPGRPEPPLMPKLVSKGSDYVHLTWRPAVNNGAAVNLYYVYVSIPNTDTNTSMYQFGQNEGKLVGLSPATTYRFRITSVNALGESFESVYLEVTTKTDGPPPIPAPVNVIGVSPKSVRLSWSAIPDCTYMLEFHDVAKKLTSVIRDRLTGTTIQIGDLSPNSEYHFRLAARNSDGESPRSEWTVTRTQPYRPHYQNQNNYQNHNNHYVQQPMNQYHHPQQSTSMTTHNDFPPKVPTNPVFIRYTNKRPEIGWKCYGPSARENIYNLEGSTIKEPNKFRTLYRGPATSHVIAEDDIHFVRVQSINKRGAVSDFTEKITMERLEADRAVQKPEKLPPPEIIMLSKSSILIKWKAIVAKPRPKCTITYVLQRTDLKEGVVNVYSGGDLECTVDDVPSQTQWTVRIRAIVSANEFTMNGDWSETSTLFIPRDLPQAPTDLYFDFDNELLTWQCSETDPDVKYVIQVIAMNGDEEMITKETSEKQICLEGLSPGAEYEAEIKTIHDDGESEEIAVLSFTTPATVPTQPEAVTISSEVTQLIVQWTSADANGSPIIDYQLTVFQDNTLVQEAAMKPAETDDHEFVINDLEPNTIYRVEICAENDVGLGDVVTLTEKTKPLPPIPPKLECEPEANAMRLRWKSLTTTPMSYKLVRVNKNDQLSTIYEGEHLTAKVKNLTQDSDYTFQIRVTDKTTGISVWSEASVFRTSLSPPPTVRIAPTATLSTTSMGYHMIEWSNVLPSTSNGKLFYRLQVAEANDPSARWHTVYEGIKPSFLLNTSQYKGAIHLRVFCVRCEAEGETKSQASPVTYVANEPVEIKPSGDDLPPVQDVKPWRKWFMKSVFPILIVILFVLGACLLANFCDWLFNLTQKTGPTFSTNIPNSNHHAASPSSSPSKMSQSSHRDEM